MTSVEEIVSSAEISQTKTKELVVLLQGGAMRAAFGAGALYEFAMQGIVPDTLIAASASFPSALYFASGQIEEMRKIWTEEVCSPNFLSYASIFTGKPIYNIDYLVFEVFRKKYPLNVDAVINSKTSIEVPLYDFQTKELVVKSSKDEDFEHIVWTIMRLAMIVHNKNILPTENLGRYVDGELDPSVHFKIYEPKTDARHIVIWNEARLDMHIKKYLGEQLFLRFQGRHFPEEVRRMLQIRPSLIKERRRMYDEFRQKCNPIVIQPDSPTWVDGFDVALRARRHMNELFEAGRSHARIALAEQDWSEF